jgi:hypothetical protein
MTIVITLIAVFRITLGAFGALWAQDYWRQRTAPRELKPILDWRPTLRMDLRATPRQSRLRTIMFRRTGCCKPRKSASLRASVAIRILRFAGVRLLVVRYVTLSQHTSGAGPTIKERMNRLYASEVNVGNFTALTPNGGEVLSLTGKDGIETSASEEPIEARPNVVPLSLTGGAFVTFCHLTDLRRNKQNLRTLGDLRHFHV